MEHDLFLQVVMPRSENLKLSLISIGNIRLLQFPAMYSYGQTLKSLSLVKCSGFKSLFSSPMVKNSDTCLIDYLVTLKSCKPSSVVAKELLLWLR